VGSGEVGNIGLPDSECKDCKSDEAKENRRPRDSEHLSVYPKRI